MEATLAEVRKILVSRRRIALALASLPLLAWVPARAAGMKRLGIFAGGKRDETLRYFAASSAKPLAARGWIEGKTLEIVWRFGENDESRFAALAKDLVGAKPDVIATASTPRTRALQRVTRTIPILTVVGDPVGSGFAQSLARPGGNITGFSLGVRETAQKSVQLLRTVLPKLTTLAVVSATRIEVMREIFEPLVAAAREAGIEAQLRQISTRDDIEAVLRSLPTSGRGAAMLGGNFRGEDEGAVYRLAVRLRVPAMVANGSAVEAGGLLAYSLYLDNEEERTAALLDKLLRGADPAVIPFELPNRSEFAINRRTAKAIGVTFPADFALQATSVFD